jgi:hypothetical protein
MKRVACVLLLALAGCGGGGGSSVSTPFDPPAQGQSPPPPPPPPAIRAELLPVAGNFTPTFDAEAARSCASQNDRIIDLTAGRYEFQTPPRPMPCALVIQGQGIGATYIVRTFSGANLFEWTRGTDHGGGGIRDASIASAQNATGGAAIKVTATPDTDPSVNYFNRHSLMVANIQIGRESGINSNWDYGIWLDGSRNPDNQNGIAPGIRSVSIRNLTVSGTHLASARLDKARGSNIEMDCYIPLDGFQGILISDISDGTRIESRNCLYQMDAGSSWVQLNGTRTEAKSGDPTLLPAG